MPSGDPLVSIDRPLEGVRLLTLQDARRHNAIGATMRDALVGAAAQIAADDSARVVVVTGAGDSFCSGADLPEILGGAGRPIPHYREQFASVYAAFLGIHRLTIPTIAAINGHAIGAGLNLALACDLRIVGPTARLGVTFTALGLHPGGGCTYFLTELLGAQRALQVLLTGATLSADEAVGDGIALAVDEDPVAAALRLAGQIATLPGRLAVDIKAGVRSAREDGFDASFRFEAEAQARSAAWPEPWQILNRVRPSSSGTVSP